MIAKDELIRIARRSGVGLGVFEKDYIISCILISLSRIEYLNEQFIFKGGTALRKLYFPDWRYSEDLDFSVLPAFKRETLEEPIQEWFLVVQEDFDITLRIKSTHSANSAARLRAQFIGPLNHPNLIFYDLTFDEELITPVLKRPVLSPFGLDPTALIPVYSLEGILGEKLRSILQRGKSRDYYDVWRLLKDKRDLLDLGRASDVFKKKCYQRDVTFLTADEFVSPERIEAARRYWDEDLRYQLEDLPSFLDVIKELKDFLPELRL